jgi:hypothetical protein
MKRKKEMAQKMIDLLRTKRNKRNKIHNRFKEREWVLFYLKGMLLILRKDHRVELILEVLIRVNKRVGKQDYRNNYFN